MNPAYRPSTEFDDLLHAMCEGELSPAQGRELETIIESSDEACRHYLCYIHLHGTLHWDGGEKQSPSGSPESYRSEAARPPMLGGIPLEPPMVEADGPRLQNTGLPLSVASSFLPSALHGSVGWLSSGWPVAYLIATVVLGIGILVGAITHVSQPEQVAGVRHSGALTPLDEPQTQSVGRITGMVDCRWERKGSGVGDWGADEATGPDKNQSPIHSSQSLVCRGDQFALRSGLMEITYDSGTRVILQGPATYEIESGSHGYLSAGKLTARVDSARPQAASRESEVSNPHSPLRNPLLSHSPLFTVRTPAATVTDLGTEFGVEVTNDKLTQVHVIEGSVRVAMGNGKGDACKQTTIAAGQAVMVSPRQAEFKNVFCSPALFIRTLAPVDSPAEKAYADAVLADRPLGYWPLSERSAKSSFRDRSGHGFHGSAMHKVACGRGGPLGADTNAVSFDGASYIDVGRHDEFALKNNFTVEAWARIDKMKPWGCVISATDQERTIGWGLSATPPAADNGKPSEAIISFVGWSVKGYDFSIPLAEVPADRWVHLAVAFDRSNAAHLYLNGQHRGSIAEGKPAVLGPVWVQIGCDIPMEHCWRGGLAHVAVYPRALTDKQIQNHYNQRTKSTAATSK